MCWGIKRKEEIKRKGKTSKKEQNKNPALK